MGTGHGWVRVSLLIFTDYRLRPTVDDIISILGYNDIDLDIFIGPPENALQGDGDRSAENANKLSRNQLYSLYTSALSVERDLVKGLKSMLFLKQILKHVLLY